MEWDNRKAVDFAGGKILISKIKGQVVSCAILFSYTEPDCFVKVCHVCVLHPCEPFEILLVLTR